MTEENSNLANTVSNKAVANKQQPQKEKEQQLLEEFMEQSPVFTSTYVFPFLQEKDMLKNSLRRNLEGLVDASSAYHGYNHETHLINTHQGVLNIQTRQLEPRDGRLFDRILPEYAPTAQAPAFVKLLNAYNTDDYPDLSQDLLHLFAYQLFGNNKLKTFFIIYGDGDNAKSTLFNLVSNALGINAKQGYSTKVDATTFMGNRGNFNVGLSALNNSRFSYADELKQGVELDGNLIKQLVAGENSTVEFEEKGKKQQSEANIISPIILLANDVPNFKNADNATISRIALIKFTKQFVRDDSEAKRLIDLAMNEQAGIFNMILDAYQPNWQVPAKWTNNAKKQVEEQVFDDEVIYHLTEALKLSIEQTHDSRDEVRRAELHQTMKTKYYDVRNIKMPTKKELEKLLPIKFKIGIHGNYYTKILMK